MFSLQLPQMDAVNDFLENTDPQELEDIRCEYGWHFILVFKDGNLPIVWEEVNRLLPLARMAESHQQSFYDSTHRTTRKYRWIKNVEYKQHEITWVECIQTCVQVKTGEEKKTVSCFLPIGR